MPIEKIMAAKKSTTKSFYAGLLNFFNEDEEVEEEIDEMTLSQINILDIEISAAFKKRAGKSRDVDAEVSHSDRFWYYVENSIAADKHLPFTALAFIALLFTVFFAIIWYFILQQGYFNSTENQVFGMDRFVDSLWVTIQVMLTQGYEELPDHTLRATYFFMIFFSIIIFATFLGFITDSIQSFMNNLEIGRSKVAGKNHTMILGWNEATQRLVCQICLLRRAYILLNTHWYGRAWFPVPPSTSVAASKIVILNSTKTKPEMHDLLEAALTERGISSKRTRLGKDIVCRVGDPTNPHDLIRAGAQYASSIVTMTTELDDQEYEASGGKIKNGATIRTLLALRHVIFTERDRATYNNLRIVLQCNKPSRFIDAASFEDLRHRQVVHPIDLSVSLNAILFACAAAPGVASVLAEILNFDGAAIRQRKVLNMVGGPTGVKGGLIGCTFTEASRGYSPAMLIGVVPGDYREMWLEKEGRSTREKGETEAFFGMCVHPSYVLKETDLLIFIGIKSRPTYFPPLVKHSLQWEAEALEFLRKGGTEMSPLYSNNKEIAGECTIDPTKLKPLPSSVKRDNEELKNRLNAGLNALPEEKRAKAKENFESLWSQGKLTFDLAQDSHDEKNILIIGWRNIWAMDKKRFLKRIAELARTMSARSTITFFNGMSTKAFRKIVRGLKRVGESDEDFLQSQAEPNSWLTDVTARITEEALTEKRPRNIYNVWDLGGLYPGVLLRHAQGDAASYGDMSRVILRDDRARAFNTAIVLGTQLEEPGKPRPSVHSRDTRVLSIMLLIRKLCDTFKGRSIYIKEPMHVIGENQEDMTAELALPPKLGARHKYKDIDFINSQAINARVLAQTLAFPDLKDAILDMLTDGPGSPYLKLVNARAFFADAITDKTPLSWGFIKSVVTQSDYIKNECITHCIGIKSEIPRDWEGLYEAQKRGQSYDTSSLADESRLRTVAIIPESDLRVILRRNDKLVFISREVNDFRAQQKLKAEWELRSETYSEAEAHREELEEQEQLIDSDDE